MSAGMYKCKFYETSVCRVSNQK